MSEDDKAGSAEAAQLLQRTVSPQRMPSLQALQCGCALRTDLDEEAAEGAGEFIASVWLLALPRLSTLTSLALGGSLFVRSLSAFKLFGAIGAHNLPELRNLKLRGTPRPSPFDAHKVKQMLMQMVQLTSLSVVIMSADRDGNWLHSLHHLPALQFLDVDVRVIPGAGTLQSISSAPKLRSLICNHPTPVARLARLWWRRLGEPQLNFAEIDEDQRERSQGPLAHFNNSYSSASSAMAASSSAPSIRELSLSSTVFSVLDRRALAYLAHLPHLHTLTCALWPDDIPHLALLRQLRSLTIHLHPGATAPPWSNDSVRAVADTRLPRLHTLRLESGEFTDVDEVDDPNANWPHSDASDSDSSQGGSDGDGVISSDSSSDSDSSNDDVNAVEYQLVEAQRSDYQLAHASLTTHDGLHHLLQLPALTRLAVPEVPTDTNNYLRACAAAAGRTMRVDITTTSDRRGEFEQRWIEQLPQTSDQPTD